MTAQGLAGLGLLLALVAVGFLLVAPFSQSMEAGVDPATGEQQVIRESGTLLGSEGVSIVPVLAVPVVLAGLGVVAARRPSPRMLTAVAAAYTIGVVLASASIGLLFVPSVLLVWLARWRL